mmetsp:Transcript_3141/g.14059  ORF Transcript_3141/g.14059 Transcript_3141/m.14059 type:complete len:253 (-) Transcript_3141:677-1435(-)
MVPPERGIRGHRPGATQTAGRAPRRDGSAARAFRRCVRGGFRAAVHDAGAPGGARGRHVHAGDWRCSAHPAGSYGSFGSFGSYVGARDVRRGLRGLRGRRPAAVPGVRRGVCPRGVRADRARGSEALDAPRGGRSGSPRRQSRRSRRSRAPRGLARGSGRGDRRGQPRGYPGARLVARGRRVLPVHRRALSQRRGERRAPRRSRLAVRRRSAGDGASRAADVRPVGARAARRGTRRNGGCRRGCRRGCRDSA